MPGWHPPSFRSEGGITAVLERRRREVEERLGHGGGGARAQRGAAGCRVSTGEGEFGRDGEGGEELVRESGEVLLGRSRYQPGRGGGGMI